MCPDFRSTGAYREHTPLLLETESHAECSNQACSCKRRAVTLAVVLISAVGISCTSRRVRVIFTTYFQLCSTYAALTILPVTDPQSLNEPAAVRPLLAVTFSSPCQNCMLPGPRSASLLLDSPQPQSVTRSLECYTARAAGAVCCMRPKRQGWTPTCQRHLHSCHPSH